MLGFCFLKSNWLLYLIANRSFNWLFASLPRTNSNRSFNLLFNWLFYRLHFSRESPLIQILHSYVSEITEFLFFLVPKNHFRLAKSQEALNRFFWYVLNFLRLCIYVQMDLVICLETLLRIDWAESGGNISRRPGLVGPRVADLEMELSTGSSVNDLRFDKGMRLV